ncbi:50S ribosomal protein L18e [Candidatus Woesearchaeota archaeon]|nr:50S ribosomal protein L18e [Candidatus Woesearchaeota archaeon]
MAKINHKNNELAGLIAELKKLSIEKKVKIWKRLAEDLEKPTRSRRIVNIYKLNKYTKNDEFVVVPGKVLGTGDLAHSVSVAAYSFSDDAFKKISEKGKALTIKEVMKNNPEGKNIRIIG